MRTVLATLALLVAVGATPVRAVAQETAVRFPITEVTDTAFTFRLGTMLGEQRWVRVGMLGMVVDPREQDVLVARFRVTRVAGGTARAVVTGQTTSLSTQHSVLLFVPETPWYKHRFFWVGAAAGAALGLLLGQI